MRALFVTSIALAVAALPAAVIAASSYATVRVTLKVADSCIIHTPEKPSGGKDATNIEAVVSGCSVGAARAAFTVATDPSGEGRYVATVNF